LQAEESGCEYFLGRYDSEVLSVAGMERASFAVIQFFSFSILIFFLILKKYKWYFPFLFFQILAGRQN
jgi:hypothetical protein